MVKNLKLSKKLSTIDRSKLILGIAGLTVLVTAAIVVPVVVTNVRVTQLKEHDPIIIWGDSDFELYDFPGQGTAKDPYKIKKLNITTEGDVGISIWNTTKYFVINNCYVNTNGTGIQLRSIAADTAFITDTVLESNPEYGIYVYDIPQIVLTDNICIKNEYGIYIESSLSTSLIGNVCVEGTYGISLIDSGYSFIIDNICHNNDYGVYILSSSGTEFVENSINNNIFGVYIEKSDNCMIIDNSNILSIYGFYLKSSNGTQLTMNTVIGNHFGLFLESNVTNCLVFLNEFDINEDYGIYIQATNQDNLIHHNNFIKNGNTTTTSQAYDDGTNTWFDVSSLGGNFWDDYLGYGNYPIDGLAGAEDLAPLDEPA